MPTSSSGRASRSRTRETFAALPPAYGAIEMADIAHVDGVDATTVAEVLFELGERLGL